MSRHHTKVARRRAFRNHCARVRLDAWLAGHPSPAAWDEWVAMRAEDDRSRRRYAQRHAWLVDGVPPDNPWGDWRVLPEDIGAELARRGDVGHFRTALFGAGDNIAAFRRCNGGAA